MMNVSRIAMGLGLGFAVVMTGCVIDVTDGGDDSAGVTTTPATTTATGSGGETPAGSDDGSTSAGSGDGDSSTGPAACDPACEPTQECMDGVCVDVNEDSTGEPPAECGLAVQLDFPNPECGECLDANCCDQLQTCFGDENVGMETECLTLNNCIATNCADSMTLMEVEECVEASCADSSGSFDDWVSYQMCLGTSCNQACF